MNIQVSSKNMAFLECFSSHTRVKIIELLNTRPMNIKELAEACSISSAIVTKHIQKLEDAGIIRSESWSSTRGRQKVCFLLLDSVTLQLKAPTAPDRNRYTVTIPIGQYTKHEVKAICGLASKSKVIGMFDDPRYFSDPQHVEAAHIWFSSGSLEYRIPNYLLSHQRMLGIVISLEICSEAPNYNENWPSDIYFYINDICIGSWTCPGDFGTVRGVFTPDWWEYGSQYGLLKSINIQPGGSFVDGIRMSDVSLKDISFPYGEPIRFRIEAPVWAKHSGGLNLFGKKFGNYDQDIEVAITYNDG